MISVTPTIDITNEEFQFSNFDMEVEEIPMNKIRFSSENERVVMNVEEEEENLYAVGFASHNLIQNLGKERGFPSEYLLKLPTSIQAGLLNYELVGADKTFSFVKNNNFVTNMIPSHRPILHPADVGQTIYNLIQGYEPKIITNSVNAEKYTLKIETKISKSITSKIGDTLSFGLQVDYVYGTSLEVALYLRRLICLNGATTTKNEYSWKTRVGLTPVAQLDWLMTSTLECIKQYPKIIQNLRLMSETGVDGDVEKVLLSRARQYGITGQHHNDLLAAFRQEPGTTEYDLWNAITRFGTHGNISSTIQAQIQESAGDFATKYSRVIVETNRDTAERMGGRIIRTIEASENE